MSVMFKIDYYMLKKIQTNLKRIKVLVKYNEIERIQLLDHRY